MLMSKKKTTELDGSVELAHAGATGNGRLASFAFCVHAGPPARSDLIMED
jgi:hypothetical protein